jgi:hypothetical protein
LWGNTLFLKKDYLEAAKKFSRALHFSPGNQTLKQNLAAAQNEAASVKAK